MCAARARPPIVRSVQTPEALAALRTCVDRLPTSARERGEAYITGKQVQKVWAGADHYVEARVVSDQTYNVTLFLTLGRWTSRCNCDRRENCKHATPLVWPDRRCGGAVARRRDYSACTHSAIGGLSTVITPPASSDPYRNACHDPAIERTAPA